LLQQGNQHDTGISTKLFSHEIFVSIATMSSTKESTRVREVASLPLIQLVESDIRCMKMSFKLLTDPTNEASPKVTFVMFALSGGESLWEHLVWREKMDKVINGLNLDTPIKKITAIKQLVHGAPLTSFRKGQKDSLETFWMVDRERATQAVRGAILGREVHVEAARAAVPQPELREQDVLAGLQNILRDRSPYQVLEVQKRFMRCNMCKPANLTMRMYVNHLNRVNER